MSNEQSYRKRGSELLKLLADHGPVSIQMLHKMTLPPMPKKNLRQSLGILKKKNLIDTLSVDPQTVYYQISQALPNRKATAEILESHHDSLVQPLLRRQDWFHNQWCEYWALSIKRLFPEAQIVREHTIDSHDLAKRLLQVQGQDFELMPDLLLIFPRNGKNESMSVAFEIERTRKSNERIMRKFKKYMNGTLIDGLIYICDTGRLSETIRELYQNKLLANSQRVRHYGDHFFLFSDTLGGGGTMLDRLYNAKAEQVSFADWCHQLLTTKRTLRRDAQFKTQ